VEEGGEGGNGWGEVRGGKRREGEMKGYGVR